MEDQPKTDLPPPTAPSDNHPIASRNPRQEQLATRLAFLVAGLLMSSVAPLVPLLKAQYGLNDSQLGLLLLCIGTGSLVGMPLSGGWAARYGCRKTILVAGTLGALSLPLIALFPAQPIIGLLLFILGAAVGTADVVMNIQAVLVEEQSPKPLMSGFHGLYSVGGILGAGGLTLLLYAGLKFPAAILILVALIFTCLILARPGLLPFGSKESTPPFAFPQGKVALFGVLCLFVFLAEGSVLDWSGVTLTDLHLLNPDKAGVGYVAFALAMSIGRLTGDRIVTALGPVKIVVAGALTAASGFALAAYAPSKYAAVLGFALVGIGASNLVPVFFSAVGRQTQMPVNLAIASVTTMGYAGILAGPPVLGFIAEHTSLKFSLSLVAFLLFIVSLNSWLVKSPAAAR